MSFFSSRLGTRSRSVTYDPYKSYVTMLVRGEDANNVTPTDTFTGRSLVQAGAGNIYTSAVKSRFGNSSLSFPGSSAVNGLYANWGVGNTLNSNFTWECWVNLKSFSHASGLYMAFLDNRDYGIVSGSNSGYFLGCNNSGTVYVFDSVGSLITGTHTLSLNTWYHIAFTRESGSLKLWVNGQQSGSSSSSVNECLSNFFHIGKSPDSDNDLNAYLDEIRITEGIARYTNNFSPPNAPFEKVTDTISYKIKASGGAVVTNGNYKIHVFKTSTNFNITEVSDSNTETYVYLVGGGKSGQGGDARDCNYNGGNGGNGGDGAYYYYDANNYGFVTYFGSSPTTVSITIAGADQDQSGFTTGGGWYSNGGGASQTSPSQNAGGAGGGGGNMGTWGYNGQPGGNGAAAQSINWTGGSNIYIGASGGGGGGGAYNVFGNDSYPGSGGSGGANGGGAGGGGGASNGNNPGDGQSGSGGTTYGAGGGGGGGASGEPQCVPQYNGGDGGSGTAGIVLIKYLYKN